MTTVSPCATRVTRKFRVFELEYDGGRTAARVAADIEQVCADARATIFVAVQINSTLPLFNMFPVTSNAPSTVGPGTSITWTADASSGTGPSNTVPPLQRGGEQLDDRARLEHGPSIHLDAVHERLGAHLVQVWARTAGSMVAYEDWRSSEQFVVIPSAPAVYGLHWDTPRPRAGQAVTLEAVAGGGSGALEYRFVQFEYATGRWSVVREYAPSNRTEWTPPAGSGGEYSVQVWVREVGSMADYDAWGGAPFTLEPARLLIISGRAGDPVSAGRAVSLPLSGANPWTYSMNAGAIEVRVPGARGFDIHRGRGPRAYSSPAGRDMGLADFFVEPHGLGVCDDTGRFTVNELELVRTDSQQALDRLRAAMRRRHRAALWRPPLQQQMPLVSALSVTASTTSRRRFAVTFTAIGSSATDPVEYRFLSATRRPDSGALSGSTRRQNTVTWTPPSPGTYITQIWVRRRGSTASYESYVNGPPLTVR